MSTVGKDTSAHLTRTETGVCTYLQQAQHLKLVLMVFMLHHSLSRSLPASSVTKKGTGNLQFPDRFWSLKKEFFIVFIRGIVQQNNSLFWDITPCSPLKVNRRFGGACRLNRQGQNIRQARNQLEVDSKQRSTLRYIPEDRNLHNHRRKNRKFYISIVACRAVVMQRPRDGQIYQSPF
jgi:hypothetical protein